MFYFMSRRYCSAVEVGVEIWGGGVATEFEEREARASRMTGISSLPAYYRVNETLIECEMGLESGQMSVEQAVSDDAFHAGNSTFGCLMSRVN